MTLCYAEILLAAGLLVLPFLYECNHTFRYHLKFFVYYAVVMFNSVLLMPVFALKPKNAENLIIASRFCRPISSLLGLRWEIRGSEHLATNESLVVVSNHQSSIDVLGLFDMWPTMGRCTVIAKQGLFYAWPFGLAAWLAGLVFIPRVDRDRAKQVMNDAVQGIKNDQTKLWVFPEGTRRNTGQIHAFKKGAFHLAIQAQLPILPVVFSRYYFLDKNTKRFDHGKIIVTALPRVDTKGLTLDDLESLICRTRDDMTKVFHNSSREALEEAKVTH